MDTEDKEAIEKTLQILIGIPLCIFFTVVFLGFLIKVVIWAATVVSWMF